jgi:hypothetical protein
VETLEIQFLQIASVVQYPKMKITKKNKWKPIFEQLKPAINSLSVKHTDRWCSKWFNTQFIVILYSICKWKNVNIKLSWLQWRVWYSRIPYSQDKVLNAYFDRTSERNKKPYSWFTKFVFSYHFYTIQCYIIKVYWL